MFQLDNNNKNSVAGVGFEGGTPSLGTIAKSSPTFQKKRADSFALLKKIRAIYLSAGTAQGLDLPTKYHRTSLCKHATAGSGGVEVNLLQKAGRAFYKGLQTCGSVWTCPICGNKIQEIRRQEIAHGMKYFYGQGKQAVMITFTFPHEKNQLLKTLLDQFKEALKLLRKGGTFSRKCKSFGYEGLIRSLEITHGQKGWHPHTHELWFVDANLCEEDFKKFILAKWFDACNQAGLIAENKEKAFLEHSIDVRFNCSTSDYLAKFDDSNNWGIDREMAKASSKKGKKAGRHPFALADENEDALFLEYTKAIKGTAQIYWSPGLKKTVNIEELTDKEASELEGDDELKIVGMIPKRLWYTVTKKELRAKVLDLTEDNKDIVYIRSFIFTESKNE